MLIISIGYSSWGHFSSSGPTCFKAGTDESEWSQNPKPMKTNKFLLTYCKLSQCYFFLSLIWVVFRLASITNADSTRGKLEDKNLKIKHRFKKIRSSQWVVGKDHSFLRLSFKYGLGSAKVTKYGDYGDS